MFYELKGMTLRSELVPDKTQCMSIVELRFWESFYCYFELRIDISFLSMLFKKQYLVLIKIYIFFVWKMYF